MSRKKRARQHHAPVNHASESPVASLEVLNPVVHEAEPIDATHSQLSLGLDEAEDCTAQCTDAYESNEAVQELSTTIEPNFKPFAAVEIQPVSESRLEVSLSSDATPAPSKWSADNFAMELPNGGIGQRLRAAREAKGLSRDEVAHQIRVPVHVIGQLEAESFDRIGAAIFVRGFLTSYAKAVDLPPIVVQNALANWQSETPKVIPAHQISASQHLWQRYRHRMAWVLLTVVLVGPLVAYRLNTGKVPAIDRATLSSLDAPIKPIVQNVASNTASTDSVAETTSPQLPSDASNEMATTAAELQQPMMAGLVPKQETAAAISSGIELHLTEDCWLDVESPSGEKLSYGIIKAGTTVRYALSEVGRMSIGNVAGARLVVNGKSVDFAKYSQTNVANLKADELHLAAQ